MKSPKSRAPRAAKTQASQSTPPPAPPSRRTAAAPAIDATPPTPPLVADAFQLADLLDAHIDRMHGVRSVLWAMSALLQRTPTHTTPPRATLFELQQLASTGLALAGEFLDEMTAERDGTLVHLYATTSKESLSAAVC